MDEENSTLSINCSSWSPAPKQDPPDEATLRLETVVVLSLINSMSCVVGTLGNGLVLTALVNDPRLRSSTDYFISSLSMADLLVTALYQPMFVFRVNLFQILQGNRLFRGIMSCVGHLSILASVTSMFVITIDRLVSIAKPMHYTRLVTKRVTYMAICVVWAISFCISIFYSIGEPSRYYVWTYCTSMLFGTIFMYAFIFKAAKRQENKVAATHYQGNEPVANDNGVRVTIHRQRNERKAAKTVAIVIGVFFVTWVPLLVYSLSVSHSESLFLEGFLWTQTASLCNSFINPYIYCIRSHRYRGAIKKLLGPNFQLRARIGVRPRSSTVSTSGATAERNAGQQN